MRLAQMKSELPKWGASRRDAVISRAMLAIPPTRTASNRGPARPASGRAGAGATAGGTGSATGMEIAFAIRAGTPLGRNRRRPPGAAPFYYTRIGRRRQRLTGGGNRAMLQVTVWGTTPAYTQRHAKAE